MKQVVFSSSLMFKHLDALNERRVQLEVDFHGLSFYHVAQSECRAQGVLPTTLVDTDSYKPNKKTKQHAKSCTVPKYSGNLTINDKQ